MTYDELVALARDCEGRLLRTATGREFRVGVYMDCPFFTPLSTGQGRSDGKKAAQAFLDHYNQTGSTRVSDYQKITRNASYFIPLALEGDLTVKPMVEADLKTLHKFQLDEESRQMAAFISLDWDDFDTYLGRWRAILAEPAITNHTIRYRGQIIGSVLCYPMGEDMEMGYWIDRAHWGRGFATHAVQKFLEVKKERPLGAHVAADNIASQRVLEKCGFKKVGEMRGFAAAREEEIDEFAYRLD